MNRPKLVPRGKGQGYTEEDVKVRRDWVAQQTGAELNHVAACTLPYPDMRGNIENPIGSVQMPLGVAGPMRVNGEHAQRTVYVPLATTEGALVRSYERGMMTLTRAGGVDVRIMDDSNVMIPSFFFDGVTEAAHFARLAPTLIDRLRDVVAGTTRHGKLLEVIGRVQGRRVLLSLVYHTGDAHGMNMISKATDAVCRYLAEHHNAPNYHVFSGMSSEKRASGYLLTGKKGKTVTAGATIPAKLVKSYLHVTPQQMAGLWQQTVAGQLQAGVIGYNGHLANGLTALFIAAGQDVANVANSAVGVTTFETTENGDLFASVNLPSLTLATVGGGTALGTSGECLAMMGCRGPGKVLELTEIVAAMCLAGELSFGAAIAGGEFVAAHEQYGRNRPDQG